METRRDCQSQRRMSKLISFLAMTPLLFTAFGCGLARMWAAGGSYKAVENVVYLPGSSHPGHRLDLFLPPNPAAGGAPVVIFIHGGYWKNQDKQYYRIITGLYSNIGVALARRGIAAAVINYRLVPDVKIQDQIQDVITATNWVRSNIRAHGGNPDQLFLWGHSAGGHLSLLTASDRSFPGSAAASVRGVISMSGILDLVHMEQNNDAKFNDETTYAVFGKDKAVLTQYSPIQYIQLDSPPLLILTGSKDYGYIRDQTTKAAVTWQKNGVRADVRELPGLDHSDMVMTIGTGADAITQLAVAFIEQTTSALSRGADK